MKYPKPDWSEAPEGAKWLVQNASGKWAWGIGGGKPYPTKTGAWKFPADDQGKWRWVPTPLQPFKPVDGWDESLERNPEE